MLQIHKPSRIPGKIQALKEREKDIYNATSLKPQTWFNFNLKKIKKIKKYQKQKEHKCIWYALLVTKDIQS